jgi:hypothetical protein
MKRLLILAFLLISFTEMQAQSEPKILQGNTVIIQMFTCASARITSVDNIGESDVFELSSYVAIASKKYIEAMLENNKILTKLLNQYLESGYSIISSTTSSIDDCSYTYILHKK